MNTNRFAVPTPSTSPRRRAHTLLDTSIVGMLSLALALVTLPAASAQPDEQSPDPASTESPASADAAALAELTQAVTDAASLASADADDPAPAAPAEAEDAVADAVEEAVLGAAAGADGGDIAGTDPGSTDGGLKVKVEGLYLEIADGSPEAPDTYLKLDGEVFVAIDRASVDPEVVSGDEIAGVLEVPAEVAAEFSGPTLDALETADAVDAAQEANQSASPLPADSWAAEAVLKELADSNTEVGLAVAKVFAAEPVQPGPFLHTLHFVFLSVDGRGIFWTKHQLDGYVQGLNDFWVRETNGAVSFTYDWNDVVATQSTAQCGVSSAAIEFAAKAARATAGRPYYDFPRNDEQRHLVVLTPYDEESVPECHHNYAGIATVLNGLDSSGFIHLAGGATSHTFVHEMGHNLG
jgi:hypothetical protein